MYEKNSINLLKAKGINDIELVCRNLTKEGKLWR